MSKWFHALCAIYLPLSILPDWCDPSARQNLTAGLQLLSEADLSNALDDFVNRDPTAIVKLCQQRLEETQARPQPRYRPIHVSTRIGPKKGQ